MKLDPKRKRLVLHLRDPARVLSVISTAAAAEYRGVRLVVVPWRLDEVRVLQNLGIDAPSPMRHSYDWPIRPGWTPMAHQKTTAEFLSIRPRAYCLNGMGTGKTLSALWAYDYLRRYGHVSSALVIAPLSTLNPTWAEEVYRSFPHLTVAVLHGTRQVRLQRLEESADVYIINTDGIKTPWMLEALKNKCGLDCIIVDELAGFRTPGTDRFKALAAIIKGKPYVWGMTGTPIPNEPVDAWGQCHLLTPDTVPKYRGKFRDMTMQQLSQYRYIPRKNALDIVYAAMQPAVRFAKEDCIDLPPTTVSRSETTLSPEQAKAWKTMFEHMRIEAAEGAITAANEAVKVMRLVQVGCGALATPEGEEVWLNPAPRLFVMKELVESAAAKVLVFVPFVRALQRVAEHLSADYEVGVIHGQVSRAERDHIFSAFSKPGGVQVIVAQPAAMSHGLNLTAADTIIWYAPITSAETYVQANNRTTRPGQRLATSIHCIYANPLERMMFERLQTRERMQGILLDMFAK
jgi:superfamily II DNA or RNA helicase